MYAKQNVCKNPQRNHAEKVVSSAGLSPKREVIVLAVLFVLKFI